MQAGRIARGWAMLGLVAFGLSACAQIEGFFGSAEAGPEGTPVADTELAAAEGCGADRAQAFVGQRVDVLNTADLPQSTRVLFPGMSATTDFRPERLNFDVDGNDRITRAYCG